MKRSGKIFLTTMWLAFSFTAFTSCKTTTHRKDTNNKANSIPPTPLPPPWVDTSKIIKEKVLLEYVVSAKTVEPNSKNGAPFDKLDYDKIIAYDFAGSAEPYPAVIDQKGKFVPVVLRQQFLTQVQADKILSALASKSTYGEVSAACFQPHFALFFYNDNKQMNQISICLDCNYLIADIAIPAETHEKVNAGTEDEYAMRGFTEPGRKAIMDLCRQLNFTYGAAEEN